MFPLFDAHGTEMLPLPVWRPDDLPAVLNDRVLCRTEIELIELDGVGATIAGEYAIPVL
jgi:hypothetical protein